MSRFIDGGAALSPDGHWIAYQSNRSGAMAVYVERYPEHVKPAESVAERRVRGSMGA